jgi:peptide/nickel transport system substrate-binding protein
MRGTQRAVLALGVTVAVVAGVAGAAFGQSAEANDEKITFRVGLTNDIVSPNPFKACCSAEYEMMLLNYNMLFGFKREDLTPVPELAEECTPSSDSMTWTCTIRDDAMWHDGEPLTSRDIAFTYRFILDNELLVFTDYFPYEPTFETPDDTTLIWNSTQPTFAPTLPPYVPIVPEHIWAPLDGEPLKQIQGFENIPAVGSGPFQLVEWEPDQFFRMESRPGHFFGTPTIDEVVYQIFQNKEAEVQALRAGQIDFAYDLSPTLWNTLEGAENITTLHDSPSYYTNFAWNFGGQGPDATNHPAIHDLALRQAVAHATDKQAIVDVVWQGAALTGDSILKPSNGLWYLDIPQEDEYEFDLELANQILDDAGYTERTPDGVRVDPESGEPLSFEILPVTDQQGATETAELMKGWMEEIGIEFNLKPVSETRAYVDWEQGTFDAYLWSWGGDPDPDFNMSIYITSQCLGWSDGCYSNPTLDQLYDEQRTTFDTDERKEIVDEFQRVAYEEIPEIVLAYPQILSAYRTDKFEGYVRSPSDGSPIFAWRVDSYLNLKPVTASSPTASGDGGMPVGLWIGLGAVALLVVAGVVMMNRRRDEEDEA